MAERFDSTQTAGPIGWLEDDHRQLRAQVDRLAEQLEQLATAGRDQALRQRADAAEIETLRQLLNRVPALEEGLRQVQAEIGHVRAQITEQFTGQERAERTIALEVERLRLQISAVSHRLTGLADEVEPLPIRLQAINDHSRRHQDDLTVLRQIIDEAVRRQATLQSKVDLSTEQLHRLERELAVLSSEFAPLRREDEVLASRILLAMDLARQVEHKMAEVLVEEHDRRDLAERIEVLRAERPRVQHQLGDLEHGLSSLMERAEELGRLIRQESDRRQALVDRVARAEDRLLEIRQSAAEAIIQIWQVAEVHRRQEIATLQDQANDLRETLKRLTQPLAGSLSDEDAREPRAGIFGLPSEAG